VFFLWKKGHFIPNQAYMFKASTDYRQDIGALCTGLLERLKTHHPYDLFSYPQKDDSVTLIISSYQIYFIFITSSEFVGVPTQPL
jgi:hypothetical protein